jgi:hypothetical protein
MGRGAGDIKAFGSGEIAPLDADRLEDFADVAAKPVNGGGYGDRDDDRAIGRLVEHLRRRRAARELDGEVLEGQAIELYNRLCSHVRSGDAGSEETLRIAALFGESAEHLRERLASAAEQA